MPTVGKIIAWNILLLVVVVLAFIMYDGWNSPANPTVRTLVRGISKLFWVVSCILFVIYLVFVCADWYFNDSDWYPREREIEVFFKAHQWIEGEIQTCSSGQSAIPDIEIKTISCSLELNESHVMRVKFLGPIKADKNKVWKCERSQSAITCRLQ
jgi:hypothetical protein